ncbi:MAG: AvaI/BsoBI family type II restriction endonuclease [Anaerolineae bacterium]
MTPNAPYLNHLRSSDDLVTTYEATRAGFVSLALEKNRRATPYVSQARQLQEVASQAKTPADLLAIKSIEAGLLTAAGLSDKALNHLQPEDKRKAIEELIEKFLEPAREKFVEELVFRFLLTRGDTLGGSMRNIGGFLAQRKLTTEVISALRLAGVNYRWQDAKSHWSAMPGQDWEIDTAVRGLTWEVEGQPRTLLYNLWIPLVKSNVDMCLFNLAPDRLKAYGYDNPAFYIALGELKGGIDPAGADEHWKTARTALNRIRDAFADTEYAPHTFFVGAAIEKRMANEIWRDLETGDLTNAANLNELNQVASISRWLSSL